MFTNRIFIGLNAAAFLLMLGVGMIVALLPQRVVEYSGSIGTVGFIASAFAVSYVLLQFPIGRLSDRFGFKPFLLLGYGFCCLSGVLYFFSDTAGGIFLGRLFQGAGEAPIWALGPALLTLIYPTTTGKVIGIYNASIHVGLSLGPLLGVLVFPSGQGSTPFIVFSALCFSGGVLILLLLPWKRLTPLGASSQTPSIREAASLLRARGILPTLSGIVLYGACYGVFISVLPALLTTSKGLGNAEIGIFFAQFYIAISIAQLFIGPLSDKYGRHIFMVAGLIMAAVGIAAFARFQYPLIYLPLTVTSFGLGIFCVSSMAYLSECVPESLKGTITGCYYLAWGAGYFLGPLVVGQLSDSLGLYSGYYLFAFIFVVQAFLLRKSEPSA